MPVSLRRLRVFLVVADVESREFQRAALEAIRPDVLLADVSDTDQQPAALIMRMRALPGCAAIPSIVVTADDDHGARRRLLDAGYHEHVRRPIDARAFRQLVRPSVA